MDDSPELVKDPVCEMVVSPGQHEASHDGIRYAFCSLQCRERFLARPGLYVGTRGRRAPKEQGMTLLRQRRILLGRTLTQKQAAALIASLREMMGVVDARYDEEPMAPGYPAEEPADTSRVTGAPGIEITYDLLQATVAQLERRIAETGGRLSDGMGEKVRRDFVQYLEDCDLADIEVSGMGVASGRQRQR